MTRYDRNHTFSPWLSIITWLRECCHAESLWNKILQQTHDNTMKEMHCESAQHASTNSQANIWDAALHVGTLLHITYICNGDMLRVFHNHSNKLHTSEKLSREIVSPIILLYNWSYIILSYPTEEYTSTCLTVSLLSLCYLSVISPTRSRWVFDWPTPLQSKCPVREHCRFLSVPLWGGVFRRWLHLS